MQNVEVQVKDHEEHEVNQFKLSQYRPIPLVDNQTAP